MTETIAAKASEDFMLVNEGLKKLYLRRMHDSTAPASMEENNDALVQAIIAYAGGMLTSYENPKGEKSFLLRPVQAPYSFFFHRQLKQVPVRFVPFFHKKGKGHTCTLDILSPHDAVKKYKAIKKVIRNEAKKAYEASRIQPQIGQYDPLFSAIRQNAVVNEVLVSMTLRGNGQEVLFPRHPIKPAEKGALEAVVKILKPVTIGLRNGDLTGRWTEKLMPDQDMPTVVAFARNSKGELFMLHVLEEDVPAIIAEHGRRKTLIETVTQNIKGRLGR